MHQMVLLVASMLMILRPLWIVLKLLCEACDADIVLLREKPAEEGNVAEYLVRNRADENDFMEVRSDT